MYSASLQIEDNKNPYGGELPNVD